MVLTLALVLLTALMQPQHIEGAAVGYTDYPHDFSSDSKCGATKGCGGDGYSTHQDTSGGSKCSKCSGNKTIKCSTSGCATCDGKGIYYQCSYCNSISQSSGAHKCASAGGNTVGYSEKTHKITCSKCSGTGYYGKCTRCNGTGKNYKCKNENCAQNYDADYDNWKTEAGYNEVCYTKENTYSISFDANGGSGSMSTLNGIKYTEKKTLTENVFTKTGYTFLGWNTDASATTAKFANKAVAEKWSSENGATVKLYAIWKANTYKMIYQPNGGAETTQEESFTYGGKFTVKPADTFSRAGHTFNGWNTAANGSGTAYTAGGSGTWGIADNVTLYAQWKANTYKVTVNPDGGTYHGTTNRTEHVLVSGNSVSVTDPVRTGYTFTGWEIGAGDATVSDITDGKKVTVRSNDVTMTATWTQNDYTVTYDSNGGGTADITQTYHYGAAVDLNLVAEREGYIFVGWGTTPDAVSPVVSLTMPDLATSTDASHADWELTLYAIYSMEVSDVAGHAYPHYTQGENPEVYLVVWESGNSANARIYPLFYEYDISIMKYRYSLETTDVSDFVSQMSAYGYQVIAVDNAGNVGVIENGSEEIYIPPQPFQQTVYHYKKDAVTGTWIKFDTTTEMVLEGDEFAPAYVTPPEGYTRSHITYPEGYTVTGGSYVVFEDAISRAYYEPCTYKLTYNANGGSCDTQFKRITYADYYGDMPTPVRRGYTFTGWYTKEEGGERVLSSHLYTTPSDTTVYAHWQVNTYRVTYDYWTNGGTASTVTGSDINYGEQVPLAPTATKEGWTFVGWNTDPDATVGQTSITMSDTDIVLYAIYKKDIVLTLVSQTSDGMVTVAQSQTIWNREIETTFTLPSESTYDGWMLLGWTTETGTDGYPQVDAGGIITADESLTLYALYEMAVTITYDTNGAAIKYEPETKYARYNASGGSTYPTFTLKKAPELCNNSFVKWEDTDGKRYNELEELSLAEGTNFTAVWDEYPSLIAYNRYFTLEQARAGEITQAELLAKVTATDKEDGILANEIQVVVIDYNASVFVELAKDADITITYEATDSFGNTVTKSITVTITDTTAKKSNHKTYVRFISSDYLTDSAGALHPATEGGLEETSIWRTNTSYRTLLISTLSNEKRSGETWVFARADIQELKIFTELYGHVRNTLDKFLELFGSCKV